MDFYPALRYNKIPSPVPGSFPEPAGETDDRIIYEEVLIK